MNTMSLSPSERSLRNAGHGLRACLAILAAFFLGANVSRAAGSGVVDNGGFFSEQAKSDAAKVIAEVERTLHKDIAIETFREIPAELKAGVNLQDKAALGHLYQQWAEKQAREKRINGVYLLIVKEPAHLQPVVGTDTQRLAFTLKDRDSLVPMMLAKLRVHQNDEALRDGVNFIYATMKSHTNPRAHTGTAPIVSHPAQPSGGSSGWIIQALVIGVVVWVVIGIFRALSGRMGGGAAAGQPGMGGGGGFFSSLIGGMFGAAAGMWMYDQFFSNHGNSAYGADQNNPNGGDSGFTGQDSDYTSGGGGDFGNDSGGGSDSGGGGDFGGGGDSGGGGDF